MDSWDGDTGEHTVSGIADEIGSINDPAADSLAARRQGDISTVKREVVEGVFGGIETGRMGSACIEDEFFWVKLPLQPNLSKSSCVSFLTTTEHRMEGADRNGLGSGQILLERSSVPQAEDGSLVGDVVTKAGTISVTGFLGDVSRLDTASFDFNISPLVDESFSFSRGFISFFDDSTYRSKTRRLTMNSNNYEHVKKSIKKSRFTWI